MKYMSHFLFLFSLIVFPAQAFGSSDIIPGQFIVNLGPDQTPEIVARNYQLKPFYIYRKAINGFAASIPQNVLNLLLKDLRVIKIEEDKIVSTNDVEEFAVTWGIDRIDQQMLPLDGFYKFKQDGTGVTAYVIDSGIRYDHEEFGERASFGYDAFGGNGLDCSGHGTHVAGTIGGTNYGVAKKVKLKSVRVLNCRGSGATSGVIAGIDWVITNLELPAVANLSLGSKNTSNATDTAVQNLINAGISTTIAAGNNNKDACNQSPARVEAAMTIGATNAVDGRSSFSNYGSCIDWFAPGEAIESAWNSGISDIRALNGTSMAAPHAAGAAALYLQTHPTATPLEVRQALFELTTKNVVTESYSTNNHMLHTPYLWPKK